MSEKQYIKDKVTAFITVYNEGEFARKCLESVVRQVDRVIIGDDASTDGTEIICREFMEKYDHITYFRNSQNMGVCRNFILSAEKVDTEFVFHLGGHDIIPDNYVSSLKKILLERNDAVAAYSNVFDLELDGSEGRKEFYDKRKDRKNKKLLTEYFEHPSGHQRAAGFFLCPTPFYLIYALFRSETAIPVLCQFQPICACDWIVVFEILLRGKFVHSSETHYIRRNNHPNDTPEEYMKRITTKTENIVGYKMFWSMVEIVLKHFAEYNDHAISVYQKWNLYWEIEEYLRKQYHFYKKIEIPNMKQELPFGYLCYHKITSPFKKLLKLSFKIIRKIYRILLKIKITFFNLFTNKIDK